MDSLRTFLRLVVMVAALVVGYTAWQRYGPTTQQLKGVVVRMLDATKVALGEGSQSGEASLMSDPRPSAPAIDAQVDIQTGEATLAQEPAPLKGVRSGNPPLAPDLAPTPTSSGERLSPPIDVHAATAELPSLAADDDRLQPLYDQLEKLGARKLQLTSWGERGGMYRCSCEASPPGVPGFSRLFESIAAGQESAIEEVLGKLTEWRATQTATAQFPATMR